MNFLNLHANVCQPQNVENHHQIKVFPCLKHRKRKYQKLDTNRIWNENDRAKNFLVIIFIQKNKINVKVLL